MFRDLEYAGRQIYRTPVSGIATPDDRIYTPMNTLIGSVDHWLDPNNSKSLKADAVNIFETAWDKFAVKSDQTVEIETSIFVHRLSARLEQLRSFLVPALTRRPPKVVLFEGG